MLSGILLRVEGVCSIWPGRDNGRICIFLDSENKEFKNELLIEEVDLLLELKRLKKEHPTKYDKLVDLIENYGQMMYEKGSFDATENENL